MATSYTSLLGLALPVQGELSGTWGDVVNNSITSLVDSAVAGTTTLSTDADVTLTTTTGAANTAREAILLCTGARTALRNITAPAQSKTYTVINATTGGFAVVIRGVGPTTGISVPAGFTAQVAWNGSDFVTGAVGAISATSITDSGNLTFTGTGNRITGDFTNATLTSRVMFQTSTANSNTTVGGIPNGTGTRTNINAYGASDATNASFAQIACDQTNGITVIQSGLSGTGTYLPMTFYTGGSERVRVDTSGNVGIGTATTTGGKVTVDQTGGSALTTQLLCGATTNTGDYQQIKFQYAPSTAVIRAAIRVVRAQTGTFGSHISFLNETLTVDEMTEKMRIDASGNVGIGTSIPGAKLDVNGSASSLTMSVGPGASAGKYSIRGGTINSGQRGYAILTDTVAYGDFAIQRETGYLSGAYTSTIYADNAGNVGIGTTSPGTYGKLAVSDGTIVYSVNPYTAGLTLYTGTFTNHTYAFLVNNTEKLRITTGGDVTVSSAALLGYGTGSGGTVTQATSKSTAVVLNKPTGQITMNNAALAAGAVIGFTVSNSLLGSADIVNLQGQLTGIDPGNYRIEVGWSAAGQFNVRVTNISAGSLSEALVIKFAIIKGATS